MAANAVATADMAAWAGEGHWKSPKDAVTVAKISVVEIVVVVVKSPPIHPSLN